MDLKKLGNILIVGGVVVLIGAVAWWYSFFSSIKREVPNVNMNDALGCLYSSGDLCGLASIGARLLGTTPYDPKVFWIGLAALVAGGLVRATAKPSGPR
jgi:hypothetical protein